MNLRRKHRGVSSKSSHETQGYKQYERRLRWHGKRHTTLTSFAISTPVLETGENERMAPLDYHPLSPSGPLARVESLLSLVVRLVRAEPVQARALFFLVTGVGRHSRHVGSGRGLHEFLIGGLAAFVEQYV